MAWRWRAVAAVGSGVAGVVVYLLVLGRLRTAPVVLAAALGPRFVGVLCLGFVVLAGVSDVVGQAFWGARFDASGPAIVFRAAFSAVLLGGFTGHQQSGLVHAVVVTDTPASTGETAEIDGRTYLEVVAVDGWVLHHDTERWLLLTAEERELVRVATLDIVAVEGG